MIRRRSWAGLLLPALLALAPAGADPAADRPVAEHAATARTPAGPPTPARPAAAAAPVGSAADRARELATIRAEIQALSSRLEAARSQTRGLAGELAATEIELRLAERRLAEAGAARELVARQAAASAAEVERLETALAKTRGELRGRLAGLYRLGRQGTLRLLLSAAPGEQLLPSIRLARYLARRDREAIDRYSAARGRLAEERDRLLVRRAALEGWIAQEEGRRRELARLRSRQAVLLAGAEEKGRVLSERAGELAAREKKLSAFLDLLYGGSEGLAGTPMQQVRGVLDWPVRGKVTARFGPILDPRYRTRVPHNGIDVATQGGDEVKAVFPGRVLFAAPFEGYGTTVVLHHPGRVFTLYAGLSELRVGKGDMVSLGQVVGLASERLYFEIREENRPENPLSWLR